MRLPPHPGLPVRLASSGRRELPRASGRGGLRLPHSLLPGGWRLSPGLLQAMHSLALGNVARRGGGGPAGVMR